jgi:mannose-1-phosphate guanylyltransferase
VILAGGRGTRFWPLSRRSLAKQLLPLNSDKSMIQETAARLTKQTAAKNLWIVSNSALRGNILKQLPELLPAQVLAEPMGRNTAPAIGLAAFLLLRQDPGAILGLFPSDHVIENEKNFQRDLKMAVRIAAEGENIVVMGIQPTRPETGYGYIETGAEAGPGVRRVRRFREKPELKLANKFVKAGNFYWNSGMFVWSAATLAAAIREYLPETAPLLEKIAASYGTRRFQKVFAELYPKCENISIDYAVLEKRSALGEKSANIYCIPASFGWNDLGSWAAHFEHLLPRQNGGANVVQAGHSFVLDAKGNYLHAPGKFVAAVGVNDLVVVETGDALLITTRERAQDVGKIVKFLDENKIDSLT